MNNFVDKYAPIRVQHQLSAIFRKVFFEMDSIHDLFERYERAESAKFEELHQILFMDAGKADIVEAIEKMNLHVAGQQMLGLKELPQPLPPPRIERRRGPEDAQKLA